MINKYEYVVLTDFDQYRIGPVKQKFLSIKLLFFSYQSM